MKKLAFILCLLFIAVSYTVSVSAQDSSDTLSPKTQQYIDNLNEVQEAQNNGQPVTTSINNDSSGLPGFWTIVFYGALSGAAWAFWRWLKKLKNND